MRNSAGSLVCEGVGKYAFEYMTGGIAAVLGPVAGVLGSGMTGGEVFLLLEPGLEQRLHADAHRVPWDPEALGRARDLLTRYAESTGSPAARELLNSPAPLNERMCRVIPAA